MGLYAEFNTDDFGYPVELGYGITADYSAGCHAFVDTFVSEARGMVPVRTGNLMASITGVDGGNGGMLYTDCEYAQYVEYGTWKMPAQPYFEYAVESALDVASALWDTELQMGLDHVMAEAYNEAEEILMMYRQMGDETRDMMYQEAQIQYDEIMAEMEAVIGEMMMEEADSADIQEVEDYYTRWAEETKASIEAEGDLARDMMYEMGEEAYFALVAEWELITGILGSMPFPYLPMTTII